MTTEVWQWIEVPEQDEDVVLILGARWSNSKKSWYIPQDMPRSTFAKWLQASEENQTETNISPDEFMSGKFSPTARLFIDMVPSTAWFSNLRSELKAAEWKAVGRRTFEKAGYVCQACGGVGNRHPVECHERWHFDMHLQVQTLVQTVALCPACHEATHFGLARVRGRHWEALNQLMKVNGWSQNDAARHVDLAMGTFAKRSAIQWKLVARWILNFAEVSTETAAKINEHSKTMANRPIMGWQEDLIADMAVKLDRGK